MEEERARQEASNKKPENTDAMAVDSVAPTAGKSDEDAMLAQAIAMSMGANASTVRGLFQHLILPFVERRC